MALQDGRYESLFFLMAENKYNEKRSTLNRQEISLNKISIQ